MELNKQQKNAATYSGKAKNILVTAGAGCGKTRTIIARATHLIQSGTDVSRILMMAFTNRAAKEMKSRLKSDLGAISNQLQASTFHSFCLKIMRQMPKSFGVSGLTIIDTDDQNSLMTIAKKGHINPLEKDLNKEFPKTSELIKYYSYSRSTCQNPKSYLSSNTELSHTFINICAEIFQDYQNSKETKGYLDYDDLLERFTNTLKEKSELRKTIAKLFDEVLVDEMQDTNPLQFSILKHFSSEGVRLFCVGDPAQSIYKFRGAEFEYVYKFEKIFGNSTTIPLSLNYRSYQEILDLSNWLLKRSPLNYNNHLTAHRKNGGFLPSICDFNTAPDEASWIADTILKRKEKGIPFTDIMVLVRSGFDAKPIEAEFIKKEIPYYFIGGTSLTKTAHVRDVLSLLRIVQNNQDDLAWMRFLKLWNKVGEKTAEKIINNLYEKTEKQIVEVLSESIGNSHNAIKSFQLADSNKNTPKLCIASAIKSLSPILMEKYDKWNYRRQDLELLIAVADKYKTISDFIYAFTLEPMTSTEIKKIENNNAVLMITVHSAKGTEASICFVANAKQGTYPHARSYGEINAEEEERRILYVALTRAKNELFVTRSNDYRNGFYIPNKPAKGEKYFLSSVPDRLTTKENHIWDPDYSSGLSSLKDVY